MFPRCSYRLHVQEWNFHIASCSISAVRIIDLCSYPWNTIYCRVQNRNTAVAHPSTSVRKQEKTIITYEMRAAMLNAIIRYPYSFAKKNGLRVKTLYGNYYFTSASSDEFTNKSLLHCLGSASPRTRKGPFTRRIWRRNMPCSALRNAWYWQKVIFNENYIIGNKNRFFCLLFILQNPFILFIIQLLNIKFCFYNN